MLLNLSNHPTPRWTAAQLAAAQEQYGQVTDMAFPNIPPSATEAEVEALAKAYLDQIKERAPTAVHVMGEMTFTHRLVNELKAAGIPCIASTTNRTVEEKDGKKIVQFQFVRFRSY